MQWNRVRLLSMDDAPDEICSILWIVARAAYDAAAKHVSTMFWAWNSLIGGWAFNKTCRLLLKDWCKH